MFIHITFRRDHYFVDLAKTERESVPQLLIAFLNSSLYTLILKILIYIIILYLIIQSNVFKIISIFRVNFVFFGNISFIFIKLNILLFILYFIKNYWGDLALFATYIFGIPLGKRIAQVHQYFQKKKKNLIFSIIEHSRMSPKGHHNRAF